MMLTGDQDSGGIDTGRSVRQDYIVVLMTDGNQFQRDRFCLKTCDMHDSSELSILRLI